MFGAGKIMQASDIRTKQDFDANHQNPLWTKAAREICLRHRLASAEIERAGGSEHIVFFVNDDLVLKIYRPFRNCFEREKKSLELVSGKIDLNVPEIVAVGEFEGFPYMLMTRLTGELITRPDWLKIPENQQLDFLTKLAAVFKQSHALDPADFEDNWNAFVTDRAETFIERQIAHGVNRKVLDALPSYLDENLKLVPTGTATVFMHADVHLGNLSFIRDGEKLKIAGLFDFADSRRGFHEYDFLAVGVLIIQGQGNLQREFFRAYGYAENDLDETMRRRLMMLTMLYETADLRRYAMRLKPEAVDFPLDKLEKEIWSFA